MKKVLVAILTAMLLGVFAATPIVMPVATVYAAQQDAANQDAAPADSQKNDGHSGHH